MLRKVATLCLAMAMLLSLGLVGLASAQRQPGVNFSSALPLEPGSYTFNLSRGEQHFFKVKLERGQTILLTLRVPRGVDLDLVLISPERDVIDFSLEAAGITERMAYTAIRTGYHYIVVFPFGDSEGAYELVISVLDREKITVTTTTTETVYLTITKTVNEEVPVTITTAVTRTVTERAPAELVQAPWSALGLVAMSAAIVAAALVIRDGLRGSRREGASA